MNRSIKMKITKVRRSGTIAQGPVMRTPCLICQREVEAIATLQAMEILKVNEREFDSLLGDGTVHAIQTVSGSMWVCKDSLFLD